jgi:hypothetical protein
MGAHLAPSLIHAISECDDVLELAHVRRYDKQLLDAVASTG